MHGIPSICRSIIQQLCTQQLLLGSYSSSYYYIYFSHDLVMKCWCCCWLFADDYSWHCNYGFCTPFKLLTINFSETGCSQTFLIEIPHLRNYESYKVWIKRSHSNFPYNESPDYHNNITIYFYSDYFVEKDYIKNTIMGNPFKCITSMKIPIL